jgi:5-methylcytosine-specific restriction protein A
MSQFTHMYQNARWRKFRASHLQANPFCAACRRQGRVKVARIVDHVEPHRGDPIKFWAGPFQSLCKPCHDGAKQSEEQTGRRRGCDVNGRPFDQSHPVDVEEARGAGRV